MRLFRAFKGLGRESQCDLDGIPVASSESPDPWTELEERLRESRALRAESKQRILEAVARLQELGRNPPRRV
jgi:hypothetical protein